jgi:hypothetical protein
MSTATPSTARQPAPPPLATHGATIRNDLPYAVIEADGASIAASQPRQLEAVAAQCRERMGCEANRADRQHLPLVTHRTSAATSYGNATPAVACDRSTRLASNMSGLPYPLASGTTPTMLKPTFW